MYALHCGRGWQWRAPPALVSSHPHCALRTVVSRVIRCRAVRPLAACSPSGQFAIAYEQAKCFVALRALVMREQGRDGHIRTDLKSSPAGLSVLRRPADGPSGSEQRELGLHLNLGLCQTRFCLASQRHSLLVSAARLAVRADLATIGQCAQVSASPGCGPTRRSSGRSKACCARFSPPLISNVRRHGRLKSEVQHLRHA